MIKQGEIIKVNVNLQDVCLLALVIKDMKP